MSKTGDPTDDAEIPLPSLPEGMRPARIETGVARFCDGSARVEMGNTIVRCGARVQHYVPGWKQEEGGGWVTAEYGMIPSSSPDRQRRDRFGYHDKRSLEIERMIGRAIRAVVDLELVGERTVQVDCDVIQGAGGTRTASITGAWVALAETFRKLKSEQVIVENPLVDSLAAVSVGLVEDEICVDLNYREDARADLDLNVAMTGNGEIAEIQATSENRPVDRNKITDLVEAAVPAIEVLVHLQEKALETGSASTEGVG